MRQILIFLVRIYQVCISPLLPKTCRFYPTCSSYALTAVERFGVLRGGWLALIRILRCNPLFAGGVDPVPDEFSFLHPVKGKRKRFQEK